MEMAYGDGEWFTFTTTERSLAELVRANASQIFVPTHVKGPQWFESQPFATVPGVPGRRISILLNPAGLSIGESWVEQEAGLLEQDDDSILIVGARDLVEGILVHFEQTGQRAF